MNFNVVFIAIYTLSIQPLFSMDSDDLLGQQGFNNEDGVQIFADEQPPFLGLQGTEYEGEVEAPSEEVRPEKNGEWFCLCKDCPQAHRGFKTRKKLYQHVELEHFPYRVSVSQCPWNGCTVRMRENRVLINHCNARHIGYKGFKCKACPKKFYSKHTLNVHNISYHKAKKQTEPAPVPDAVAEDTDWTMSFQQQALLFQQQALQYGQLIQANYLANQQAAIQAHTYPMQQFQTTGLLHGQVQQEMQYGQLLQANLYPQYFADQQALAQPHAYWGPQFQPAIQPQQQMLPSYDQNQQIIAQPQNIQYFPIQAERQHTGMVAAEPLPQMQQSISTTTTVSDLPRRYRCQMHGCDQEFDTQDSWILHISREHYLTCHFDSCHEGPFATLHDLMKHLERRH